MTKWMRGLAWAALAGLAMWGAAAHAEDGPTLRQVRAAGHLACGVLNEPEDWSKGDLHAALAPFGIEICKAVAVAVMGERAKVDVHPYATGAEAAAGLHRGDVALVMGLSVNATTAWRDAVAFGPPVFLDGQGFLVRADGKASTLADLNGWRVCFVEGTENETVLEARARAAGVQIVAMPFQEEGEMVDALGARHCDAISAEVSRLAQEREAYAGTLGHDRILNEWLRIDPVAPAFRQGDAQWAAIVTWTVSALLQAEELGISRATLAAAGRNPEDPDVKRLLGMNWAAAQALGLDDHGWAAKVIGVTGNYGEIYARTVGRRLGLPRGRNALWNRGGMLFPLPVE